VEGEGEGEPVLVVELELLLEAEVERQTECHPKFGNLLVASLQPFFVLLESPVLEHLIRPKCNNR